MKLRSKKLLYPLLSINLAAGAILALAFFIFNITWNTTDYKILDLYYSLALEKGYGPQISPRIVHLNISNKTYEYFGKNYLDRGFLANANNILTELSPQACMFDLIFVHPSNPHDDSLFQKSLENAPHFYLPVGMKLSETTHSFKWEEGPYFDKLRDNFLMKIQEIGEGKPYYSLYGQSQNPMFAEVIENSGHISSVPDNDGVYRHYPLLIKVDSLFLPTATLSIFLNYNNIPAESLRIFWGDKIIIPKTADSYLDKEMIIPIDYKGRCYIPYPDRWQDSLKRIEMQNFVERYGNEEEFDEMTEIFEGNFVFVGDISTGIADLGHTPLQHDVPLVAVHSALMNAFLTNSFYREIHSEIIFYIIAVFLLLLSLALLLKSNNFIYTFEVTALLILVITTYLFIKVHLLIPIFSIFLVISILSFVSILSLQIISTKEEKFIKNAFSKYLPAKVVDKLVDNPQLLQLGGEERTLSLLFSDIVGFTTISESLQPKILVQLLNEYLTRMTDIVFENSGIIDKYIGDAILAEFGAPVFNEKHPDLAVSTAISMQKELLRLNNDWKNLYGTSIKARVGINTGKVIIGNMGSRQMFDYTVIGDSVNLAARLESVNKKYSTSILISESTYDALKMNTYLIRPVDVIVVKGKTKPVKIFEVAGFLTDFSGNNKLELFENYSIAFEKFLNRDFENATRILNNLALAHPDDIPTSLLIDRIAKIDTSKIDDSWDGSLELTEK